MFQPFHLLRRPHRSRPARSVRLHLEPLEDRSVPASAGTLDSTFGANGLALLAPPGTSAAGDAMVLQPDGKILVAGTAQTSNGNEMVLFRLTTTGALDSSFCGQGFCTVAGNMFPNNLALQPSGSILVGADDFTANTASVYRFTPDGMLDTSFGNGTGKITPTFVPNQTSDTLRGLAVGANGQILVSGNASNAQGQSPVLARFNADGTKDTGFGMLGLAAAGAFNTVGPIAVLSNNQVVANVSTTNGSSADVSVARYTDTGTLDPTFGTGGVATDTLTDYSMLPTGIAVQGDGKVIVLGGGQAGNAATGIVMVRFTTGGTADASFGKAGESAQEAVALGLVAGGAQGGTEPTNLALQADGKIVVTDCNFFQTQQGGGGNAALLRYQTDGSLDPAFATNGIATYTTSGMTPPSFCCVAVQTDGNLVVAGTQGPSSGLTMLAARYLGAATTPPVMTGGGSPSSGGNTSGGGNAGGGSAGDGSTSGGVVLQLPKVTLTSKHGTFAFHSLKSAFGNAVSKLINQFHVPAFLADAVPATLKLTTNHGGFKVGSQDANGLFQVLSKAEYAQLIKPLTVSLKGKGGTSLTLTGPISAILALVDNLAVTNLTTKGKGTKATLTVEVTVAGHTLNQLQLKVQ